MRTTVSVGSVMVLPSAGGGPDALRPGGSWALTITQHMRRALGAALMSTYGRRECVAPDTVLRLHVPDACRGSAATDPGISGWR